MRRSRIALLADALETIARHEGEPATRLATEANMAYDRMRRLLDTLEQRGLVERSGRGYRLTSRGRELLHELRRLRRLLEDLGLDPL